MDFLIDTHSHSITLSHLHKFTHIYTYAVYTYTLYVNQEWKQAREMFILYLNLYTCILTTLTRIHSLNTFAASLSSHLTNSNTRLHIDTLAWYIHCTLDAPSTRTLNHSITNSYTSDRHRPLHRKQLHTTHHHSHTQRHSFSSPSWSHRFSFWCWFSNTQRPLGIIGSKCIAIWYGAWVHSTFICSQFFMMIASLHFFDYRCIRLRLFDLLQVVYILDHKIRLIVLIHSSNHHSLSHTHHTHTS